MEELADVLRQERHHLEVLLYRLTTARLLLRDDRIRFLGWSSQEIQRARRQARESDLLRAANVQLLSVKASGGKTPTLRQLASVAGDPWAGILRDHHDELTALVAHIEVEAHATAEACRKSIRKLAEDSEAQSAAPARKASSKKGADSRVVEAEPVQAPQPLSTWRALPFDDELLPDDADLTAIAKQRVLEQLLAASGKLQIPSLLAFLR